MTPTIRIAWLAPVLLCVALLPSMSQAATTTGSGRIATEARSVPAFEAIALAGAIDLRVRQGTQHALEISADDNLLPLLETSVETTGKGATLRVGWKRGESISTRSRVIVNVVMPQLSSLSAAGAGDITVESFDTPTLQVALAGSGDVKLPGLRAGELRIGISGSGDVGGSGKATKLAISIAGSGDVRLADLQADEVTVKIAGSGDAAVQAQKTLDVRIAGSGDVTYRGDAVVRKSVMGSGSVTKK
ncbi:MAG: head GIN domain-containing protein [Rubrivivax sp.]|nr:head GIN domain-containing protein [Rubrivivax sp.]